MKREPCICGAKATPFKHEDGRVCITCTTGICWSGPMSWDDRVATQCWNDAMKALRAAGVTAAPLATVEVGR